MQAIIPTRPANRLDEARAYAAQGWPVVPLWGIHNGACCCGKPAGGCKAGKHPIGPLVPNGLKDATTDPATLSRWWSQYPDANIGIRTGTEAGIIVLDLDSEDALSAALDLGLPATPVVQTGNGYHAYFRHPGGKVRNRTRLNPGMDIRADDGYVVAPPSQHVNGSVYTWETDPAQPLADPPAWLLEQINGNLPKDDPRRDPRNYTQASLQGIDAGASALFTAQVGRLAAAQEGNRNSTLNEVGMTVAGLVAAGRLDGDEAQAVLFDTARGIGLAENEIRATLSSAWKAGQAAPLYSRPAPVGNGRPVLQLVKPTPSTPNGKATTPPPTEGEFNLTDLGNGERLAARHGDTLRYVYAWGKWVIWQGRRWQQDDRGEIERRAAETARSIYAEAAAIDGEDADSKKRRAALASWATRSEGGKARREMLEAARSMLAVTPDQFDADRYALNVRNGIVNLKTGELVPHDPDRYMTKLAQVDYDPAARSDLWDSFLTDATGGNADLAAFLQRAVGYTLTGATDEEVLFFIHGPAAAGKSTFIEAVRGVMGDYSAVADFDTFLARSQVGGPRNDIARLVGARFVASVEVDEGKRLAEGIVKTLTGGDTVTVRRLYQEAFEFEPAFKLWLVANDAPKVRADDDAIWRRILRIPFDSVVPKERRNPRLKLALKTDPATRAAVLAWAVRGALEWQRVGLQPPPVVLNATEEYRQESNPLRLFLADCCIFDPLAWVKSEDLSKAYTDWCSANGERPVGAANFAKLLRTVGAEPDQRRVSGEKARGWRGVGLLAQV